MNRVTGILVALFISYFNVVGQLNDEIDSIISEEDSQDALFGISVIDLNGVEQYALNEHSRFMPASTLKIITTMTGLDVLGADHRFQTKIGYSGEISDDGTLYGNLIIEGSGDPTLASPEYPGAHSMDDVMETVYNALRRGGIRCIDGHLIIADTDLDKRWIHPSWAWDDLSNYYASGALSLNFHENLYYLEFERDKAPGKPTTISKIEPHVPELSIENKVVTGNLGSGDNAYIYGNPYSVKKWVEGTIPPGEGAFRIKGSVPDPRAFFAFHLMDYLRKRELLVSHFKIGPSPENSTTIGSIDSENLYDIARYANHKSNNLYCEAIFRSIGSNHSGKSDFASNGEAIKSHLSQLGVPINELVLADGSGLSWRNRVSPNFLSLFLFHRIEKEGQDFVLNLLPEVGKEGSVRNFMKGNDASANLWLKSGSINNVLCYTGFLTADSGESYLITIMANGHSSNSRMRRQHEKIISAFFRHL